jgi:hypothetical protein
MLLLLLLLFAVDPATPKGAPRLSTPDTPLRDSRAGKPHEFNGKGGNRLWDDGQNPLAFLNLEASNWWCLMHL